MATFADRIGALLGGLALLALLASLWPSAGVPAWPAGMLGLLALGCAMIPGHVVPRAIASLAGFVGFTGALAQIALLWTVAGVLA